MAFKSGAPNHLDQMPLKIDLLHEICDTLFFIWPNSKSVALILESF